jgi:DnaJ-class molecular chaperone
MTYPLDENEANTINAEEANETFDEVTEAEESLSDSGVVY